MVRRLPRALISTVARHQTRRRCFGLCKRISAPNARAGYARVVYWIAGVVYAGYLVATGALAVIDARTRTISSRIVWPLYMWGAGGLSVCSAVGHVWPRLAIGLVSATVLAAVFTVMWYFGPVGFGDVRLIGAIGLFLGWAGIPVLLSGLIIGTGVCASVSIARMVLRRATRRSRIAWGPYLVAGSWAGLALALAR